MAAGVKPRRTIRFALWAGEEPGLLGSRDYVQRHGPELDDLAAVMNFDETGDPYGLRLPVLYWVWRWRSVLRERARL